MPDPTEIDRAKVPHDKKSITSLRHKAFDRFIKIHGHPREIALGFALGIFVGMSPTYGFQIAIGIFLAALLKWNKFAVAVGVWITNPVTAPFIYGSTYYLGAGILGIDSSFSAENIFSVSFFTEFINNTPMIFAAMIVGGILLGVPLALIGYFGSYALLKRYQESVKQALKNQKTKLAKLKPKHKQDDTIKGEKMTQKREKRIL